MRNNKYTVRRNRNSFLARARREWRKNGEMYLIQFMLIFLVGAWTFAVVVIGVS